MKKIALMLLAIPMTAVANNATVVKDSEVIRDSYSRKGGVLAGVDLSIPMPAYQIEGFYRPSPNFTLSASIGMINPFPVSSPDHDAFANGGLSFKFSERFHPNGRSFYLGMNEQFYSSPKYSLVAISPNVGWQWMLDSGVTMGIEIGANMTLLAGGERFAQGLPFALPYIVPFKIGYSF